jgi:hypothetical protein
MKKTRPVIVLCCMLVTSVAAAQPPATPPSPPAEPTAQKPTPRPAQSPRPEEGPEPPEPSSAGRVPQPGQPVNIRFDVTIIDEGGPQPSRKTVSVTVADRQSGLVRSAVAVLGMPGVVPVSLDALPMLERDGRIRARLTLEYSPRPGGDPKEPSRPVEMRLSFGIILENGKPVVAAQAADPVTDRRVRVEVTATVLK